MTETQKITRQRYFNAIGEMYKHRHNIKAASIVKDFCIGTNTPTVMCELLMIERTNYGKYRWIGGIPTLDDAEKVMRLLSEKASQYQSIKNKTKHTNSVQSHKTDTPKSETQSGEPRKIDEQYCIDFLKKTGKYEIFLIERRKM